MSVCRKLACDDCKEFIWIGQGGNPPEAGSFYYGEEHTMKALRVFLFKHSDHTLRFVAEWYADYFDGWTEVDAEDFKNKVEELKS